MKLLNLNVGIKIDNLDLVEALIKEAKADLCTLQEAMNAVDESCKDMFKVKNKLGKLYPYNGFAPLFVAEGITKNGEMHFDFGGRAEQGCLLLSNAKIKEHYNQFYYNEYRYNYDSTNFYTDEWCRSIQNAIVEIGNKELQIINVHGLWNEGKTGNKKTEMQSEFILSHIRYDIPSIVVGDFNLLPSSASITMINKKMRNLIDEFSIETTRPASKGNFVCDYVFVNDKVNVKDFKVLDNNASDHLPLVLEFDI